MLRTSSTRRRKALLLSRTDVFLVDLQPFPRTDRRTAGQFYGQRLLRRGTSWEHPWATTHSTCHTSAYPVWVTAHVSYNVDYSHVTWAQSTQCSIRLIRPVSPWRIAAHFICTVKRTRCLLCESMSSCIFLYSIFIAYFIINFSTLLRICTFHMIYKSAAT